MDQLNDPIASNDEQRVPDAGPLRLIDHYPQEQFDGIVTLAARATELPMAAIAFVGRDRVHLKSCFGIEPLSALRDQTISELTMEHGELLVVDDVEHDPRVAGRSREALAVGVRAYAGVPIRSTEGVAIGTLSVGRSTAGGFTPEQLESLIAVAAIAEEMIAARTAVDKAIGLANQMVGQARQLASRDRTLRQAERLTRMGAWRYDPETGISDWSEGVYRIYDLDVGAPPSVERALDYYPPHARAIVSDALARTIQTGAGFDIEVDFITAKGRHRRVRAVGELELEKGRPVAVAGVFQDITERHQLEQNLRQIASTDELTRIANRATFNSALETEMAHAAANGTPLYLILMDLDGFKEVNDTWGHMSGDDVLRAVGRRLGHARFAGSLAARLGGDEFALIVTDRALCADIDSVVEELRVELARPVRSGGAVIQISGTLGLAAWSADLKTMRDFLHRADTALYEGKHERADDTIAIRKPLANARRRLRR